MANLPSTYPLRLLVSIKAGAEKLEAADGTSLNQFVAVAVAEKVAALRTASYFAERRGRADWEAFDRLMRRRVGEALRFEGEKPLIRSSNDRKREETRRPAILIN